MPKFPGVIGFSTTVETTAGVWEEFSILADPYARNNFHSMRYIKFMGALWKITTVEVQYPRLILNVGGVYNDGN